MGKGAGIHLYSRYPWAGNREALGVVLEAEIMAGVLAWGWYVTDGEWLPIVVDSEGRVRTVAEIDHLDDIGDVNVPAPADGDLFKWDAATGKWIPIALYVADGHKIIRVFERVNVAAGLTNSDVYPPSSTHFFQVFMPFAGSIIGLWMRGNAVRTAGSCTATVTVGGVEGTLSAAIDATHGLAWGATQAKDIDTFAVGGGFGVSITTTADWAPTTMDITITVIAEC